jgi:RimJ/RimL family protein N-acetyltransferase
MEQILRRFADDPPLADGVVVLRPWLVETDVGCVEEASRDPDIPQGTTVPPRFSDEEGLAFVRRQRDRLDNREGLALAIADAASDRAVGHVTLMFTRQPGTVSLGYWLIRSARGRGLASRAVRMVVRWTLLDVGLARVEAFVEPENAASVRVLEAAGFRREGYLRSYLAIRDLRADVYIYSLLPTDLDQSEVLR